MRPKCVGFGSKAMALLGTQGERRQAFTCFPLKHLREHLHGRLLHGENGPRHLTHPCADTRFESRPVSQEQVQHLLEGKQDQPYKDARVQRATSLRFHSSESSGDGPKHTACVYPNGHTIMKLVRVPVASTTAPIAD